ncbi:MAG: type II toxin-antitoxin system VapC family toxin [Anaerolineales bacterium]|nr:MAG: type II toxin-antitoxin system VapC family toxin [Anaerolineales bacterium]
MKVLLDTHAFLWWVTDSPKLSARARKVIQDSNNELFFSAASGWEIAIKAQLGRLQLPDNLEQFIMEQLSLNAILVLPIQLHHALRVYTLPQYHRDPFDRVLVAQSQIENLPILTADAQITPYTVETIW